MVPEKKDCFGFVLSKFNSLKSALVRNKSDENIVIFIHCSRLDQETNSPTTAPALTLIATTFYLGEKHAERVFVKYFINASVLKVIAVFVKYEYFTNSLCSSRQV